MKTRKQIQWHNAWETVWFIVVVAMCLTIAVLMAGCALAPGQRAKQEVETTATIKPKIDAEGDVALEIENLQKSLQKQAQAQQSSVQELLGEVRDVNELVQTVTSTVRNFGMSPEDRKFAIAFLKVGGGLAACAIGAVLGFLLLALSTRAIFNKRIPKMIARIFSALLIGGAILGAFGLIWSLVYGG